MTRLFFYQPFLILKSDWFYFVAGFVIYGLGLFRFAVVFFGCASPFV
jgi:hypothetical protein